MKSKLTKSALIAIPVFALTIMATGTAFAATDTAATATATGPSAAHAHMRGNRPVLTDAQKQSLTQIRELYRQGKTTEAEALAKQAGLPAMPMRGKGLGKDHDEKFSKLTDAEKKTLSEKRLAIETAITASDYAKFATLIAGTPFEGKITESNFPKLVQAQALMKSGDHDGAHTIMKELGINGPGQHGNGPKTDRKSN